MLDIISIDEKLKTRLTPEHYTHSVSTAKTAAEMATAYGFDEEKAYVAGILHDYAKSLTGAELLEAAERYELRPDPVEVAVPYLLHAEVGARMVEDELGILDSEIINAIRNHTVGSCSMSDFDKIIYIADMVEPGRGFHGLDKLRQMALDGLDKAFREAYAHSLGYLVRARKLIHPTTVEVWNKLVAQEYGRLF